jgi:hypothetical protein
MMAMASRMLGKAINPSKVRMIGVSSRGKYPDSNPSADPIAAAARVTLTPIIRETRPP